MVPREYHEVRKVEPQLKSEVFQEEDRREERQSRLEGRMDYQI